MRMTSSLYLVGALGVALATGAATAQAQDSKSWGPKHTTYWSTESTGTHEPGQFMQQPAMDPAAIQPTAQPGQQQMNYQPTGKRVTQMRVRQPQTRLRQQQPAKPPMKEGMQPPPTERSDQPPGDAKPSAPPSQDQKPGQAPK